MMKKQKVTKNAFTTINFNNLEEIILNQKDIKNNNSIVSIFDYNLLVTKIGKKQICF